MSQYGFDWGGVVVERLCEVNGTRVIRVAHGANNIEVYVSPSGRSIRVFNRKGKELRAK